MSLSILSINELSVGTILDRNFIPSQLSAVSVRYFWCLAVFKIIFHLRFKRPTIKIISHTITIIIIFNLHPKIKCAAHTSIQEHRIYTALPVLFVCACFSFSHLSHTQLVLVCIFMCVTVKLVCVKNHFTTKTCIHRHCGVCQIDRPYMQQQQQQQYQEKKKNHQFV